MSGSLAAGYISEPVAAFRLMLLGRFNLERDGRSIRLRTRKEEGLLAYLVLHPGCHAREVLAELYWGDTPEEQARGSLRAALADLRVALGPDALFSDRVTVQFTPPTGFSVDVLEFRGQAVRFLGDPAADPAVFAPGSYGGELLIGHYDDWVLAERERLRQLFLDALLHRVGRLCDLARHNEAVTAAQQVLEIDPAEEQAHRQLIALYAITGNRPAALRQLEICRRNLREELDTEPSPETLALLDSIMNPAKEVSSAVAAARAMPIATAAAAAPVTQPRLTNLPLPLTSFIGREQEMAAISALLRGDGLSTGRQRIVTLTGAGGSGKTRLSIQVARHLAAEYRHGAWWVDLSSLRDPALVTDSILRALGVTPAPGQTTMHTLIDFLRDRSLLLLLDNCEHLLEACVYILADILQDCPSVCVLATSREPLGIPGEQLWPVPTFGIPAPNEDLDPECLIGYDAVRLFLDRARMQRPTFELKNDNAAQVAEICRRLDGIPLAIELAAARVRTMDLGDILTRLQNRLRLLATHSALAPPRQQTLRASIDWSYNLLSQAECFLLQRLAVFVGGCTLAMVESICPGGELGEEDVFDALGRLVDRSLVIAEAGRYRLLETIREYALERLLDSTEAEALPERHSAYFAAWMGDRLERIQGSEQRQVILDITIEIGNIRAAWDWAVTARRDDLLRCMNLPLVWYCELDRQFHEGEALFARTVEELSESPPEDSSLLPLLRAEHGFFLFRLGMLAEARQELEEGCAWLRQVGTPGDLGIGLTFLGMVVWQEGEYPRTREMMQEALELNRSVGDSGFMGLCLFFLGLAEQSTGGQARAEACFGEALALGRSSGHPRLISMTSIHSVSTLLGLGQAAMAMERLQEGLALARALQDRWLEFAALGFLGRVLASQKDFSGAASALRESLELAQEIGNLHDMAWGEVGLADVSLAAGELAQAETHYRSALRLAMKASAFPKAVYALVGIAALRAQVGDREGAIQLARQVLLHPASAEDTRTRAAKIIRMVDPQGAHQPDSASAATFEEVVQCILAVSPGRSA